MGNWLFGGTCEGRRSVNGMEGTPMESGKVLGHSVCGVVVKGRECMRDGWAFDGGSLSDGYSFNL